MLIEAPYVPVQDAPVVMARVQQRQKTRPDPAELVVTKTGDGE